MMRKIVVFDSGWGGELIGDYIRGELPVEVEKVIDWRKGSYGEKSAGEVRFLTERALLPHIGGTEVIVLAEPIVELTARRYLEEKYPAQRFVGYGDNLTELVGGKVQTMILMATGVKRLEVYQESKAEFRGINWAEPECAEWSQRIDDGELSDETIGVAVKGFKGTLVLYSTGYIDVRRRISGAVGRQTEVVDMRRALLRDVCSALKLKGVDGRAPKDRFKP